MRTTIELSDQHRAKLLELAAERGEKGLSRIVQEAIDRYLADESSRREKIRDALALEGTLHAKGAGALEDAVRLSRSRWR